MVKRRKNQEKQPLKTIQKNKAIKMKKNHAEYDLHRSIIFVSTYFLNSLLFGSK